MNGHHSITAFCLLLLTACIEPIIVCDTPEQGSTRQSFEAPTETDALTLYPATVTVVQGGTVFFQVNGSAAGARDVSWGIKEKDGGTIWEGHFDAPQKSGVFHVFAEKRFYDPYEGGSCGFAPANSQPRPELIAHHLATATVTVVSPSLAIVPAWAEVATHSTTRFRAVSNLEDKGPVSWYLGEGTAGTVKSPDENDLFFIANENTGTYHIRAVLRDHPEVEAFLAVTVSTAPAPVADF